MPPEVMVPPEDPLEPLVPEEPDCFRSPPWSSAPEPDPEEDEGPESSEPEPDEPLSEPENPDDPESSPEVSSLPERPPWSMSRRRCSKARADESLPTTALHGKQRLALRITPLCGAGQAGASPSLPAALPSVAD